MTTFLNLNYLAVIVSSIVYFAIGAFWYSRSLFGTAWGREIGLKMDGKKPQNPAVLPMIGQFVSAILFAIGIAVIIQLTGKPGIWIGVKTALLTIILFVFPINSGTLFFKNKPVLFLIEGGYQAVGALVIGIILAVWR